MSGRRLGIASMALGGALVIAALLMGFLGFPSTGFGAKKIAVGVIGLLFLAAGVVLFLKKKPVELSKSRLFNGDFLLTNAIVPLIVLVLYSVAFTYLSTKLRLNGVSSVFFGELWLYGLILLVVVYVFFFFVVKARKDKKIAIQTSGGKIRVSDLLLLLLPLTPVVQYVLNNRQILSITDALIVLLFFLVFSAVFILAVPMLLGVVGSTRTLMAVGLTFTFSITFMDTLSHRFAWYQTGTFWIQLLVFASVFLAVYYLSGLKSRWILYVPIIIFFLANTTTQVVAQIGRGAAPVLPAAETELAAAVKGREPVSTPNIYLLVYDSYVASETMLSYGIDNHLQEDFLVEQGFTLYPQTYSIQSSTLTSMGTVLDAGTSTNYNDERRAAAGNGIVQNILEGSGYKTYGIFPTSYMFSGTVATYDVSFPESVTPPYIQLSAAILMGEFRFDLNYGDPSHGQYVDTKRGILESIAGEGAFLYTHSDFPGHSQNSGACLANEIDLFKTRLIYANDEMRQDVRTIIANDPGAIVIVAGDHGPYLTRNCAGLTGIYDTSEITRLDIQDRYGTFLAVRWPTADYSSYDDITVLQDLFPAVFAYMYQDASILGAKTEPVISVSIDNDISGVSVDDGVILGGVDDGSPLFVLGE